MDLSDIINKTADITADALRGYLSILLSERYGETNWRDDLLPRFARKAQSRASYASTYKKVVTHIEHVGVEHYSLQDMDISFLCAVLLFDLCDRYCQDAPQIEIPQSIRRAIELLRDDKNESDSHRGRGAAEPLYNQLRSAIIWQNDLFRFVAELEANMSQMGKQRELLALFCSKTRIDIKGIENLIKRHFSEASGSALVSTAVDLEIKAAVEKILQSENPAAAYSRMLDDYPPRPGKYRRWFVFHKELADKGFLNAAEAVANCYYSGVYSDPPSEPDYESAAYYYNLAGVNNLSIPSKLNLVTIYSNGLSSLHTKEEGEILLAQCRTLSKRQIKTLTERNGINRYVV